MADYLELARAERRLAKSARKLFEDGLVPEDFHDHHIQCAEYWEAKAKEVVSG